MLEPAATAACDGWKTDRSHHRTEGLGQTGKRTETSSAPAGDQAHAHARGRRRSNMRSRILGAARPVGKALTRAYGPEALQSNIPLDSLVKVDLLRQEEPQRVKEVWLEHHNASETAVGDVLTPEEADIIQERGRKAPHFVLPVFRGGGFVNLLANTLPGEQRVLFSHLEDYKMSPATAASQLTLALYDEFALDKSLVLLRGERSDVLLKKEAHQLMKLWIHMYTDEPSFQWVETFNLKPAEFDFNAYMKAFEKLQKE